MEKELLGKMNLSRKEQKTFQSHFISFYTLIPLLLTLAIIFYLSFPAILVLSWFQSRHETWKELHRKKLSKRIFDTKTLLENSFDHRSLDLSLSLSYSLTLFLYLSLVPCFFIIKKEMVLFSNKVEGRWKNEEGIHMEREEEKESRFKKGTHILIRTSSTFNFDRDTVPSSSFFLFFSFLSLSLSLSVPLILTIFFPERNRKTSK